MQLARLRFRVGEVQLRLLEVGHDSLEERRVGGV